MIVIYLMCPKRKETYKKKKKGNTTLTDSMDRRTDRNRAYNNYHFPLLQHPQGAIGGGRSYSYNIATLQATTSILIGSWQVYILYLYSGRKLVAIYLAR